MSLSLLAGEPSFVDETQAALLREQGAAAAWRAAFERAGGGAAAGAAGPFAVAQQDGGRAFLAVDRLGIETLCYRIDGRGIRVAQRADALAGEHPELDPQALFDYFYFHCIPSPRTIFAGVHRLPAAHSIEFDDGRLVQTPYWVPHFREHGPVEGLEALKSRFRALVRDAVAARLQPGGIAACFLSGGTDSSTVAGMIGQVTGAPAHTYSIGFQADGYDEMAYARIAARHFGTRHHEYYVTPDDLVRHIPAVAAGYDQPFGNSSALPSYCCALRAREDGVTRLLAGDGGDELFGGNSRYAKQRVFDVYDGVPGWLRRGLIEPLVGGAPPPRLPGLRKLASYVSQARTPMPDRQQAHNLLLRLGPGEVLSADFLARVDASAPLAQQREVYRAAATGNPINRTLAFDWRYTLAENDLPKVSGTTRLAGVEVRYPLLDERLLEFSLGLPPHYKLRGLKLRWFFKEALRGFLPDEILRKKKHGFGLPFGVWLGTHEGLKRLAADSLASFATRGVMRPDFLRRLLADLVPAHPGYYGEMVWIVMMLEQWLRHHAPDWRLAR